MTGGGGTIRRSEKPSNQELLHPNLSDPELSKTADTQHIVALAAVIIPNVAKFSDKGDTGAQNAENENVQTALDTMMADKGITAVDAQDTATDAAVNIWTGEPTGTGVGTLDGYLRETATKYWYCWDSAGRITKQYTAATADCTT